MMGSVGFGNISAAAGPAARVGQQKVMAFDFDQTFIPGHTNGWPYNQNRVTKKAALNVLSDPHYREYLQKLQGLGFKIVVVTRGIEADVARALNEAGLSDIIAPQDVYGALVSPHDTYSNGHEQSGRPARIGINTPKEWESKKVEYLNYIMTQYHTTKDNVYFYDDTPKNVEAAQASPNGLFPHSYVVDWKNGVNGVNLLKAIVAEQEKIAAEQQHQQHQLFDDGYEVVGLDEDGLPPVKDRSITVSTAPGQSKTRYNTKRYTAPGYEAPEAF